MYDIEAKQYILICVKRKLNSYTMDLRNGFRIKKYFKLKMNIKNAVLENIYDCTEFIYVSMTSISINAVDMLVIERIFQQIIIELTQK